MFKGFEYASAPGVRQKMLPYVIISGLLLTAFLFFNYIIPLTPGRLARASSALFHEYPLWALVSNSSIPVPERPIQVGILLVFFVGVMFLAYSVAVVYSWNRQASAGVRYFVVGMASFFFLTSVFALPTVNTDIFNYILRGRVAAVYGANPYYTSADKFPNDPIYTYAGKNYTSEPGDKYPAWTLINIALAEVAGDDVVNNLLIYRSAFFVFNMANLLLVALILRQIAPQFLLSGLIIYGWNPIVVVFGQSKSDVVLTFYLLLAILLISSSRRYLAYAALALSVFVKLITLPLLVLFCLREFALKRWKELAIGSTLIIATTGLIYAPFMRNLGLIVSHLGAVDKGGAVHADVLRYTFIAVFVGLVLWFGLAAKDELPDLLKRCAIVMIYLVLFLLPFAFSWYSIAVVALLSLVPDWRLAALGLGAIAPSYMLNIWRSTFSPEFKPPVADVPSFLLYLAIPLLVMAFVIARHFYLRGQQMR